MSILKSKTDTRKSVDLPTVEEGLLESITNDEILSTFMENLRVARKKAQGRSAILELKMADVMTRIERGDFGRTSIDSVDIDEIEKSAEFIETKDTLLRKWMAFKKAKERSWTLEAGYRRAMLEYRQYCKPILTDLETVKQNVKLRISAMKEAQKKELNVLAAELNGYEKKVKDILLAADLKALYVFSAGFEAQFGRIPKSDDIMEGGIKEFETPVPGYPKIKLGVETRPDSLHNAGNITLWGRGK